MGGGDMEDCCSAEQASTGTACTLGLGCPVAATPKGAVGHPASPKRFFPHLSPPPPQAAVGRMKPLCKIRIKAPDHPMGIDRQ